MEMATTAALMTAIFAALLSAFSIQKKAAPSVILVFVLLSAGSVLFAVTSLTNNSLPRALSISGMFLYGPAAWGLIRSHIAISRDLFSAWHTLPAILAFVSSMLIGDDATAPLQLLGSLSRALYGAVALREYWANRASLVERQLIYWLGVFTFIACWDPAWNLTIFLQHWLGSELLDTRLIMTVKMSASSAATLALIWWALVKPEVYLTEASTQNTEKAATEFDKEVFRRLSQLFEKDRPHLEPSLRLEMIADNLGVTPRELSNAVNRCTDASFRAYLRHYRVKQAKHLFALPENAEKSVFQIALEAGFATASSFHDSFKAETGMTPRKYRLSVKN